MKKGDRIIVQFNGLDPSTRKPGTFIRWINGGGQALVDMDDGGRMVVWAIKVSRA